MSELETCKECLNDCLNYEEKHRLEIEKLKAQVEILEECVKSFSMHDACGEYGYSEATEALEKLKEMRGNDE